MVTDLINESVKAVIIEKPLALPRSDKVMCIPEKDSVFLDLVRLNKDILFWNFIGNKLAK